MLRMRIVGMSLWVCVMAAAAGAANPTPVATLTLPGAGQNAYLPSARYSPGGLLHVWDGIRVWRQDGANLNSFTAIGSVDLDGSGTINNSADAGPINFSADGGRILLGNGFGGMVPNSPPYDNSWNGLMMVMPAAGGVVTTTCGRTVNHVDFVPLPASSGLSGAAHQDLVDQGSADYASSWVTLFDEGTGQGVKVIDNIPGPGASLAVRGDGEVFATIGYGDNRGEIRGFALAAIEAAYTGGTALNWTDGTPLTGPGDTGATSGAGMFFDPRGFLFAGGNEGVTVFAPDGRHRSYDLVGYYTGIEYDPAADRFITLSDGKVYDAGDFVPEPCSLVLLGLGALAIRRRSMQYMEIR